MNDFVEEQAIRRAVARLGRRINRTARETRGQARAAQAPYRSVEGSDGATTYYGEDGEPRLRIGPVEEDGIFTVTELNPEAPPIPTTPTITQIAGGVAITYDGTFEDGNTPPDLAYFEIHASDTPDYFADDSTQIGTFASPQGGTFTYPTDTGTKYYSIQAVSNSGVESDKSEEVSAEGGESEGGPTEPPADSPELTVSATAEALILEAEPVDQFTQIIYEFSDDYDPDTEIGTWTQLEGTPTKSTVYVVATHPVTGDTLEDEVTYYFRATATNGLPPDPAPSTVVGTALDSTKMSELITAKLVAGFILGETIQVGSIIINADTGIEIPQPNGKTIKFPSNGDPASITAALTATALTIAGNSFVNGLMQVFAKISLVQGITNPTEAPIISTTHPFKQSDITESDQVVGMCDTPGGTEWALARPESSLKLISKTTGLQTGTVTLSPGFAGPILSVTMLGGKYYTVGLHLSTQRHMIARWSATGTHESTINLGAPSTNFPSHNPALGNDGTDLLLAYVAGGNDWRVATIDPTTGAVTDNIATDVSTATDLRYVGKGNFDFGASRIVIGRETGGSVRVFNASGVSQTASNFNRATTTRGMVWDGTRFLAINDSGRLYEYSRTTLDTTVHGSYDWCDPDGTPRTEDSPAASASVGARTWARIEGNPAPQASTPGTDKAERVGIYASVSGAANLKRQIILPNGESVFEMDLLDTGGVAPAGSNEFLAIAAPGIIDSVRTENISGTDHPLTRFAGDGTFSLLGVNTWDSGTLTPSGSYAGGVRLTRIGKQVFAFGQVSRDSGSNSSFHSTGITVPVWARPASQKIVEARTFYNAAGTYRFRVDTDGTLNVQQSAADNQNQIINCSWFVD